jgi:hypothetical protein
MTTEIAPLEWPDEEARLDRCSAEIAAAASSVEKLAAEWQAAPSEAAPGRPPVYRGLVDQHGEPWRAVPEPARVQRALDEFAVNADYLRRKRRAGRTLEASPYHHLVVLSSYHVANLRALLYAVESGEIPGWNNGDWVGEASARLPVLDHSPNRVPQPMADRPTAE